MSIFGHIQDMPLTDVLQMLSAGKRSGVLTMICRDGTGRIMLNQGRVVFAMSDTRKRLGGLLLEQGYVSLRDLSRTLAEQKSSGDRRPIGTLLIENGLLTQEQLESVLKPHVVGVFHDFLSKKEGLFHFETEWLVAGQIVFQEGLSVERLLLQAARLQDEGDDEPGSDDEAVAKAALLL